MGLSMEAAATATVGGFDEFMGGEVIMAKLLAQLREWWGCVACALWLHRDFDRSRRLVIFGSCAVIAGCLIGGIGEGRVVGRWVEYPPGAIPSALGAEFQELVHRAFMPRVYVQLWKSSPLIGSLLAGPT